MACDFSTLKLGAAAQIIALNRQRFSQSKSKAAIQCELAGGTFLLWYVLITNGTFSIAMAYRYFFQCFNSGTTASMCARTCSAGQFSFAMCATQKSISCSLLS